MPSASNNNKQFSRCIASNRINTLAPFHWLRLAAKDLQATPLLSLFYGLIFSVIPATILYVTFRAETHLVILPAIVAFSLIGPVFAVGLYDVAWQLEKGQQPTLSHSLKSMFRNSMGEWGFALVLTLVMIVWLRLASLLHALYPSIGQPSLGEMAVFLTLGSALGLVLMTVVFALSAFTPQICLERRVDLMTAIVSSVAAVRNNPAAMLVWAGLILTLVTIGFATFAIGFIFIMPLLSFASWHAYIAIIKTKTGRHYE
ncbi:MAG: putative membrane protein [Motiliproteus sp.]|jgi:uncharacterized membrane protein